MSKKRQRYQKAQSPHLKQAWKMNREAESTEGITIDQDSSGKWIVVRNGCVLSEPFNTQPEAFKWVERNFPAKRYGW
jgi:hypothetical protein